MSKPVKCDCTVNCGDDPWLRDGRAQPCAALAAEHARLAAWRARPRVLGVGRMGDNPRAVLVSLERAPTDDELRALHDYLRGFAPGRDT